MPSVTGKTREAFEDDLPIEWRQALGGCSLRTNAGHQKIVVGWGNPFLYRSRETVIAKRLGVEGVELRDCMIYLSEALRQNKGTEFVWRWRRD